MPKTGKCAICGQRKQLSYDHIPPKCCGNNGESYYISFTPEYLGNGVRMAKRKHSQNGIKFQTICSECNNGLGGKYDENLGAFRQFVIDAINGRKHEKGFDLNNVIKAVVGHLLSASEFDPSLPARAMRDYYFDKNEKLLDKYSLLVCFYPYQNSIFILKNYVPMVFGINDPMPEGMLSSFYFFPFAFILCDKQKLPFGNDIFETLRIPSQLKFMLNDWGRKFPTWPAIVDNNHAFIASAAGKDSVFKN